MTDWAAPFQMPRFSTEEFETKKAEHNADHGYTIYVPGFEDVVHLKYVPKLTEAETVAWAEKDWSKFSTARLLQLTEEKQKKKLAYQRMLDSPSPEILRSRSSLMTSIDNAQDALGTLAVIGSIAKVVAPRAIAGFIGGPVGWVITAAALMNMANKLLRTPALPMLKKRKAQSATKKNPRAKKAHSKLAKKLKAARINRFSAIEALQTTDNLWGVGLCLGPIMGLGGDLASGAVRTLLGQDVRVSFSPPQFPEHEAVAANTMKDLACATSSMADWADDEWARLMITSNLASQMTTQTSKDWNALDAVPDLDQIMVEAPKPTNPLVREVMEEAGHDPDEFVAWPTTGEKWSTYNEIGDSSSDIITQNYRDFENRTKSTWMGFVAGNNVADSCHGLIAQFEGEMSVGYDYIAASRFITGMYDAGLEFHPDTTELQFTQLADFLELAEAQDYRWPVKDLMRMVSERRGINIQFIVVQA